jgi:hypothetical protein
MAGKSGHIGEVAACPGGREKAHVAELIAEPDFLCASLEVERLFRVEFAHAVALGDYLHADGGRGRTG